MDDANVKTMKIEEYLELLRYQDAVMEKMELILYKLYRVANSAASADKEDVGKRMELQKELEHLMAEFDTVTKELEIDEICS